MIPWETLYRARCALCGWRSGFTTSDDSAFDLLASHGVTEHPAVGFPGGELIPTQGKGGTYEKQADRARVDRGGDRDGSVSVDRLDGRSRDARRAVVAVREEENEISTSAARNERADRRRDNPCGDDPSRRDVLEIASADSTSNDGGPGSLFPAPPYREMSIAERRLLARRLSRGLEALQ